MPFRSLGIYWRPPSAHTARWRHGRI